jgi:enterochelin esterase family protein
VPDAAVSAVDGDVVTFRLADPEHRLDGVRLWVDVDLEVARCFERRGGVWELRLTRLPLDRIEYLFDLGDGLVPDPGNPLRVGGAFGDHSWLPLAGYVAPAWLTQAPVAAARTPLELDATAVGPVDALVWAPADATPDEPLPLLVSHDGPEMDAYGGLTHYVGAMIAQHRLPRLRTALLAPGERNQRYAANATYAAALVEEVLPAVGKRWATANRPVLMGQSLGALAGLHAAWTHPGVFAGVFLQSGSFFTPETDPQESTFSHWADVCAFVASVLASGSAPDDDLSVTMVCGTAEENLGNNRVLARHLTSLGLTVRWGEARDGHHWTCWRDLLDPHLTELLTDVWG